MQILIAPDSFKSSISAEKAAEAIKQGLLFHFPAAEYIIMPLSDGGEGFCKTMVKAKSGEFKNTETVDPLDRPITGYYGVAGDTAIIEIAQASGFQLLKKEERNPAITTSFGTGLQILQGLNSGYRKFIIGLGGSVTNDAGAGMLQALGASLKNRQGKEIGFGGQELKNVWNIDLSNFHPAIQDCEIVIASDVNNPLTGPNGASLVYGPQKGASEALCRQLDQALEHFADKVTEFTGKDVRDVPGAGAAGGFGAAFLAFFPSTIKPGFDIVKEASNLEELIIESDLIVCGEGKIDDQTKSGKVLSGIAKLVNKHRKNLLLIGGVVDDSESWGANTEVINLSQYAGSVQDSIKNPEHWIKEAIEHTEIKNLRPVK